MNNPKKLVIDPSKVKYPDLDRITQLKPNPHILLGKEITWTEKRDGSNFGVYLDAEGNWHARSRNMDVASEQFHNYFKMTPQFEGVIDLLKDAEQWNDAYMVFGELLMKGKSPTKIEFHDEHSFVVFDLWSAKTGGFVNYTKLYQECYHHHLPIVEVWGVCNVTSIESLLSFRDTILATSVELGREGSVGKYVNGAEYIYFKEKNDIPKYEKVPRVEEEGKIILPPLPDSELCGAIEKVYMDTGDGFFDVSKAMPLIAEYVKIEQKKHNCAPPERKLFDAYKSRCDELRLSGV
jgi:RNA ligase